MEKKKIGFISPWYGDKISGGAETALRDLVKHLQAAGVRLEVLTTCVESFTANWNQNYHKQGLSIEGGIPVRRFRVRKRNIAAFDYINAKLIQGKTVSQEEESIFQQEMVNSPDLYSYMNEHKDEYSHYVFTPYMFGTTFWGCQICPEKSILIPCFHDETYAHMNNFREAFSRLAGMIYLSDPEKDLAQKLFGCKGKHFITLGTGVDTQFEFDTNRFRDKYRIREPFLLYAGRKDSGKRVDVLVKNFVQYKRRKPSDLKLVLIGGGKIGIPSDDILDLGFLPLQDKYDAYAAASIFCNPSEFESFSLVIMESWLAGRPVIVNGDCPVTKSFAIQSNGGLYYENYSEFEKCVSYLMEHPEIAEQMGRNGCRFVKSNFAWDVIVDKYIRYFDSVTEGTRS